MLKLPPTWTLYKYLPQPHAIVLLGERERAHLVYSIPQLSTRFFLCVISIFPAWALCSALYSALHSALHMHSLDRISASQLRQSMLTQPSTAHGDLSLAAPMLTARFSCLVVQLARFSIDADSDFHSTRRPVSSSANAHCQVYNWHDFSTYIFIYIVRYRKVNQGTLEYLIIS